YVQLVHEGTTLASSAYGTVFYLTTGFHGLHVTGGLIAFVYLLIRTKLSKFTPQQATAAIVVSYYWHFLDVLWIGLFTVIYFIRGYPTVRAGRRRRCPPHPLRGSPAGRAAGSAAAWQARWRWGSACSPRVACTPPSRRSRRWPRPRRATQR